MDSQTADIAGLVRSIVTPLIDFKDELEITETAGEGDDLLIEIRVNEEDAGKVIGRQGRVIKAIRTLSRAAASRAGMYVDVELID